MAQEQEREGDPEPKTGEQSHRRLVKALTQYPRRVARRFTEGTTGSKELIPHADIAPLFRQLTLYNVGQPIIWNMYEDPTQIGHVVRIKPLTDLLIMNDGRMQLRTVKADNGRHTLFAKNTQFPTEESTREYLLRHIGHAQGMPNEEVIQDTSNNRRAFREAIQTMHDSLEQAKESREHIRTLMDEIMPTDDDVEAQAAQAEAEKEEQRQLIDELAKERLEKSKALIAGEDDEASVVGYVIPVPRGDDETTRKFIFLKNGDKIVIDIPEGSEMKATYDSEDESTISIGSQEIFSSALKNANNYTIITSNRPGEDNTALEENAVAASEWIKKERAARESLLASRGQTSTLVATAREGVTERPIEEVARELLKEDFLGIEAVRAVEHYLARIGKTETFNLEEIPEIPYSVRDLELAKQNGEMLVLRPQQLLGDLGVMEDLSLARLVDLFYQNRGSHESVIFIAQFLKMEFPDLANTEDIKLGWALVRKNPLAGSVGSTIGRQNDLLLQYAEGLRRLGADNFNVRRRTGTEAAWDTLLYFISTGTKLLSHDYDLTSTDAGVKKPLLIGKFGDFGMRTDNGMMGRLPNVHIDDVGVCSTR